MNIEQRIRAKAREKIKVRITGKKRSQGGFYVWWYERDGCGVGDARISIHNATAKTKKEALQMLLAKVRCFAELDFAITPRPRHRGDK